jgi:hypothetical protein
LTKPFKVIGLHLDVSITKVLISQQTHVMNKTDMKTILQKSRSICKAILVKFLA